MEKACSHCGATNKEGSNYCNSCGAYLFPAGAEAETQTAQVNVAFPEVPDLHLRIRVGACRLTITPSDSGAWIAGVYRSPKGALPLRIHSDGGRVTLTQEYDLSGLGGLLRYTPRFELALGKARPYALTVEAGASDLDVDLGAVPLRELAVKQGAGRAAFDFAMPNPQQMGTLAVNSGAVGLQMKNLGNANFREMVFSGGAASYKFDFGGTLQRDARAKLSTSMARVEIRIPSVTAARVFENTAAAALDVGDGFAKKGGAFLTEAAVAGKTPILTIRADVSLGTLVLRSTQ